MKDQNVIEALGKGKSSRVIRALYQEVFPQVLSIIQSNGGGKVEAEDVFQESLIILIRKVENDELQIKVKLSTYLCAICKYIWWNQHRKLIKQTHLEDFKLTQDEFEGIEQAVEKERKYQHAETAFNKLGTQCQKILQHFYLERKSMQWIASKLGLKSEKVAKNQKYKCLKKAQTYYSKISSP